MDITSRKIKTVLKLCFLRQPKAKAQRVPCLLDGLGWTETSQVILSDKFRPVWVHQMGFLSCFTDTCFPPSRNQAFLGV